MAAFVKEQGIPYPVAVDRGTTASSFAVDSFPDYYLIDRSGKLRVADLQNSELDRVVAQLLAEKAPAKAATPGAKPKPKKLSEQNAESLLGAALREASRSKRRVLVHIGGPG